MRSSLARAPYDTVNDGSICAVEVERAESVPVSPVYQITVLAAVPAVIAVAVSNGGPSTRCGGLLASPLKKSFDAVTADAAVSEVAPILVTPAVTAFCRFNAVLSLIHISEPTRRTPISYA